MEITVTAAFDQIGPVTDLVNEKLDKLRCPVETKVQIDVAIDEILSNIIRYAYPERTGTATLRMDAEENPLCAVLTFIDRGIPFNPLAAAIPDALGLPVRQRRVGGLGLYMVRNTMDHMDYRYQGGQNILTIRKTLQG